MRPVNEKIAKWLDEGLMYEVLVGSGPYHLEDYDSPGTHDVMLATRTLIEWATVRGKEKQAAEQLESILARTANEKPIMAADIILAFAINARDLGSMLGANFDSVVRVFDSFMDQSQRFDESTLNAIRRLRPILSERLAQAKDKAS